MTQLDEQERSKILDDAIRPYVRRGWLIQSQSATRAQLLKKGKKSGLLTALFFLFLIVPGIFYLLIPARDQIINFEVDERGKVRKTRVR